MDNTYNNIYRLYQECLQIQNEIKECFEEFHRLNNNANELDKSIKKNINKLIKQLDMLRDTQGPVNP